LTGRGPEESGTDACTAEEEDDITKVVVAVLYGGRWLGVMLGSKASRGRTGTSTSVLEVGQRRARRCSGDACGEVEAVPSEERGGEKGLGFDDSPWAAVDKDDKCTWGRRLGREKGGAVDVCGWRGGTVPGGDGRPNAPALGAGHLASGPWPSKSRWPALFKWAGPISTVKNSFPIISNYIKLAKYESCTSCSAKFSQLYQGVVIFKRNNFPFGKKFKFPTDFELKIQEANLL
jgi:hypothetical protein